VARPGQQRPQREPRKSNLFAILANLLRRSFVEKQTLPEALPSLKCIAGVVGGSLAGLLAGAGSGAGIASQFSGGTWKTVLLLVVGALVGLLAGAAAGAAASGCFPEPPRS
jgi:hypothetical protein